MLKISFAGRLGLSPVISFRRSSLLICVWQPQIVTKKSLKALFWGSMSFNVIDVGSTGKLVGSACYDTQQVAEIALFQGGNVLSDNRFPGGQ